MVRESYKKGLSESKVPTTYPLPRYSAVTAQGTYCSETFEQESAVNLKYPLSTYAGTQYYE